MRVRSYAVPLLVGLLSLLMPCAVSAQLEKAPRTKSGFVATPEGVKIHYLEAGHNLPDGRSAIPQSPSILFVPGWTMPA
ncbi:MAG: hypothetical protein L0387_30855, partial [Acidobacteria bacterium]|nr:hypothetical protein [Acidobacteriota bacterium]